MRFMEESTSRRLAADNSLSPSLFNQGVDSTGLHSFEFRDGVLIVSDSQLERLAIKLDSVQANPAETAAAARDALKPFETLRTLAVPVGESFANPEPCAWNLFLRRR